MTERDDLIPGRWWRALLADGSLWCESSNEQEVRDSILDKDGARVERWWTHDPAAGVWRLTL